MDTIQQLSEEWFALQPLKLEDQKRLDDKFRMEFNYNSNHLEGNTLTYGETKLALMFDQTKGNHELREYEEMKAHDVALKYIKVTAIDPEHILTENFIRELNKIILMCPFWKEALNPNGQPTCRLMKVGGYKEHPNSVRQENGEIFEYATPVETPILMQELIDWYRQELEKGELSPIKLAALLHYKYICIHPFDDGNGRIARLLVNYVLFKNQLPPIIIKSEDKTNYFRALHAADAGIVEDFIEYMENQLLWSLDIGIRAAKGESIQEPDDLDKKIQLLRKDLNESPDDDIKKKYGKEAVRQVLEQSVFPLLLAWEERLQKFDTLLLDRTVSIDIYDSLGDIIGHYNENEFKKEAFDTHIDSTLGDIIRLCKRIFYRIQISGFRKIDNKKNVQYNITIEFRTNTYEIEYLNKIVSKRYHKQLTELDINNIVLDLGNNLFEEIEEATNKAKS